MANEGSSSRYRFSVPAGDAAVLDWIKNQDNLSYSLRLVIRDYIQRHGYGDATCLDVAHQAKRGRPSNAARDSFDRVMQRKDAEPVVDEPDEPEYRIETEPVHHVEAKPRAGAGVRKPPVQQAPAQLMGLQETGAPRAGMSLAGITMPKTAQVKPVRDFADPKDEVSGLGPSNAASRAAALLDA